ncbi:hypothetical protein BLNAU_6885 [Blattamonas nauphoetae]|uniref:Uncharacterized protein n=1 Tax=Blattamonas nauphoetae TaxID=2049346 RepID=A0ABQ9Y360_9EUKA|nr:hypothetical protein BLNAU_6885 [Blattamonas nauphoetae]
MSFPFETGVSIELCPSFIDFAVLFTLNAFRRESSESIQSSSALRFFSVLGRGGFLVDGGVLHSEYAGSTTPSNHNPRFLFEPPARGDISGALQASRSLWVDVAESSNVGVSERLKRDEFIDESSIVFSTSGPTQTLVRAGLPMCASSTGSGGVTRKPESEGEESGEEGERRISGFELVVVLSIGGSGRCRRGFNPERRRTRRFRVQSCEEIVFVLDVSSDRESPVKSGKSERTPSSSEDSERD